MSQKIDVKNLLFCNSLIIKLQLFNDQLSELIEKILDFERSNLKKFNYKLVWREAEKHTHESLERLSMTAQNENPNRGS